ncbi:nucleoside hydrolase [Sphingobacterium psychroaquaticum]|uniref:nucleoside hydrolase n=1 Tax=Sphingobacterium psychroaquaticum TaxID=561061 RepID=UPI0010698286|nr:nucleoside hydrolase [Sphingobacterium psychroaquaticum]QBQ41632.1 nucleoside hydrolase [Sphingobacterium psychroaquaticum]
MKRIKFLALGFSLLFGTICITASAQHLKKESPALVILDTDMGNDIDDVMAIDILYKYADQKRAKVLGIMNNKSSAYSTRLIDMLNTWYGYGSVPIGRIEDGVHIDDYVDYSRNMVEMNQDSVRYRYSVKNHAALPEAHILYRKLLAAQKDQSVTIISIGFSTNLARLLQTEADQYSKLSGRELVQKKVKLLSLMAGSFGEKKRAEFNVIHDIPSAQFLFANWPGQIVVSPFEIGKKVIYPGKNIETDYQWARHHPLVDSYKRYRPYPYDRPTWDLTSVYYVFNPNSLVWQKSALGKITIDDKGFMFYEEGKQGKHVVLDLPDNQVDALKDALIQLLKTPTVKRQQ